MEGAEAGASTSLENQRDGQQPLGDRYLRPLPYSYTRVVGPAYKADGTKSTYQPDFYIEDLKSYIEVKGYETDLDKAKWKYFTEKLIVLRRKEIGELDEWFKSAPC